MSTINPSSAKRFTVEIYRREGRTAAEIDGDRDGSHQWDKVVKWEDLNRPHMVCLTNVQIHSTTSYFGKAKEMK